MRRIFLSALALAMFVVGPVGMHEARAHEDVCMGTGSVRVDLQHLFVGPSTTSSFILGLAIYGCAVGVSQLTAIGTLSGTCELTMGSGITNTGHTFDIVGSGMTLVFSDEVTATVRFHSYFGPCAPMFGHYYEVTGAFVLSH